MTGTQPVPRREDVEQILAEVRAYASRRKTPALAVLVGLPASGKTRVAEELLAEGVSVVLDATNVTEAERAPLCRIAEHRGARLVLIQVNAPDQLIRRRLARRDATAIARSEADIHVYRRMRSRSEPIERPHHVVDTSQELEPALAAIAKEMTEP